MGIKHLNRYLVSKCSNQSITHISLQELSGRTIVIDTSIYLYKFLQEESLLPNFQTLITTFAGHDIKPIFVFDGKPPAEKRILLQERQKKKRCAEIEYNRLKQNPQTKQSDLDVLKKLFIRVTITDINNVKTLMMKNNVEIVNAIGESDRVCVSYVKSKMAWGCLSDDMDMFIYGCPRVFRQLSLIEEKVTMYSLPQILSELKLSAETFCDIVVLSGTDYNRTNNTLFTTLRWYRSYEFYKRTKRIHTPLTFYSWLFIYTNYVDNYDELLKLRRSFIT